MATVATLLTAEEFTQLPDTGQPTELVKGKIVPLNMPSSRHGVIDSVFEVCGPGESWVEIYAKVGQYLRAGVLVVCISDEKSQTLTIFSQNDPPQTLPADAEFSLPAILGDFRVTVRRFFE